MTGAWFLKTGWRPGCSLPLLKPSPRDRSETKVLTEKLTTKDSHGGSDCSLLWPAPGWKQNREGSKATRDWEDMRVGAGDSLVPGHHLHPSTPRGRGAVGTAAYCWENG